MVSLYVKHARKYKTDTNKNKHISFLGLLNSEKPAHLSSLISKWCFDICIFLLILLSVLIIQSKYRCIAICFFCASFSYWNSHHTYVECTHTHTHLRTLPLTFSHVQNVDVNLQRNGSECWWLIIYHNSIQIGNDRICIFIFV